MNDSDRLPGFLYVVSNEVCNPLGGVHTVLATAAPFLKAVYGEDLLFVGPDLWANRGRQAAFTEDATQPLVAALAAERDIPVRFGRWEIEGRPAVALVDSGRLLEQRNRIFGDLWNDFSVDSIDADWDTAEQLLFGYAAGMLTELHYHAGVRPRAVRAVAHFHQWITGAGLLRVAKTAPEIGTVFTPHGTVLGRALASDGEDPLASDLTAAAETRGMKAQHSLEHAAAKHASILASVSEHAAEECAHILGRRPEITTPNGYSAPRDSTPRHREEVRAQLFRCAERFFGSPVDPEQTRIVLASGPYQFHNKGLDTLLKALGRLQRREPKPARPLLVLLAVSAAQTGPRHEVMRRLKANDLAGAPCGVCTHNLAHPADDPILKACREAEITNAPGNAVRFMFVPVLLDGRDPVLPLTYNDVLQASDLTVFPSVYEPWGYTPLESLAAGVPTITTDATGFGRFVGRLPEEERDGITVLDAQAERPGLALEAELERFLREEQSGEVGNGVLARTSWDKLLPRTLKAHAEALKAAGKRRISATTPGLSRVSRRSLFSLPRRSASRPQFHRFTVAAVPPPQLARLPELARNIWWSWNPRARALFEALDPDMNNPVRMLRSLDPARLLEAASDPAFLELQDEVLADFDGYLSRPRADIADTAYFCAEFALHDTLPIYSGGLGVLAGDHLKSASDLQLPLVGVGLRYAKGYFVQRIQPDGRQGAEFVRYDPRETPLTEVVDGSGEPLSVTLRLPGGDLHAKVWRVDVGSVQLYLLDTLVKENDPDAQAITERLYVSDRESRLRQELLLGMGGWRMLRKLGKLPEVCHLNEGHSAFLLLERLLDLVEEFGMTYQEAAIAVRSSTMFTTHTPVPAGHDRFSEGLMRRYFGHVAQRLGLDWDEFFDLGRTSRDDHEFSMTVLALNLSGRANGVSRLHGEVSREMLDDVWPGTHVKETPVGSITNGVHLATWAGTGIHTLLERHIGPGWSRANLAAETWQKAEQIPDDELWETRTEQKRGMVAFLRRSIEESGVRRGEPPTLLAARISGISEDALWIGYARRFAPYKRATLLFRNMERLIRLLENEERPVRIVFAGKSHPDDAEGADLVRQVVEMTGRPGLLGRVFFVEDYDMAIAHKLVTGVDVWLNTPTRPLEASGTSGMKACLNGGLHFSVLDGWWCEGYDGANGWAIGEGREYSSPEMQAEHDSRSLYGLLETEIVPQFFDRDEWGRPAAWLDRVRRCIATIPPVFTTHRMVADYVRQGYAPLGERAQAVAADEYLVARRIADRNSRLTDAWTEVHIEDVSVTDLSRGSIGMGDVFEVRARVELGALDPDEVAVDLYVGPSNDAGELVDPVVIGLLRDEEGVYTGAYMPTGPGSFRYGVRVQPVTDDPMEAAHLGLVRWA